MKRSAIYSLCLAAMSVPLTSPAEAVQNRPPCHVWAHRSGTTAATDENTIPAVLDTVSVPGGWLDTDLRATSDHVPVILHDRNARRVYGHSLVVEESTREQTLALRSITTESVMPDWDEYVRTASETHTHIMAEIKKDVATWSDKEILSLWDTVVLYGMERFVYFGGTGAIETMLNRLVPDARRFWRADANQAVSLQAVNKHHADLVQASSDHYTAALVSQLKANGIQVSTRMGEPHLISAWNRGIRQFSFARVRAGMNFCRSM